MSEKCTEICGITNQHNQKSVVWAENNADFDDKIRFL